MSVKAAGNGNGSEALLLTVWEAAELLRISRNLAYDLATEGRLPHVRLGRRILMGHPRLESRIVRQPNLREPLRQFASAISAREKDDREE